MMMKGTFKVIDGEPFVQLKDITLKLDNVKLCATYNIGPKDYESRHIWSIIPFTDIKFWADKKPVPTLYEGQKITIEKLNETKAKVNKLEF
jgi:hypothetical protein